MVLQNCPLSQRGKENLYFSALNSTGSAALERQTGQSRVKWFLSLRDLALSRQQPNFPATEGLCLGSNRFPASTTINETCFSYSKINT